MNSHTQHPRGTMKAITQLRYGGTEVLSLAEVEAPVPGGDEVLIRVRAVGVSAGDILLMHGEPRMVRLAFGLRRPKQPTIGRDVAGEVEAVGAQVTRFRVGDAVYAESNQGGFAEFVAVQERFVALRPTTLDAVHSSAVPVSGTTALQGLRLAGVTPGQHVLVNGASGGVGGFAVQLAKAMGAEVTGVCRAAKADHVRAIGADHVIDYTAEDFTRSGQRYDFILDNVANHSLSDLRRAVTPTGALVPNGGGFDNRWFASGGRVVRANVLKRSVDHRLRPFLLSPNLQDLVTLKELIEAGKITPVMDRTYPLSETPQAIGHVGEGHARGKVAITVEGAP